MPAPKGHKLWGNPCKPKLYQPDELWDKAVEYFEWCDSTPWYRNEFNAKVGDIIEIPTQRPYSIEAFCIFANMTADTFNNYSKKEGYETYFGVCSHIRKIIDSQHFEGGMVGAFNANIVTRKLGLAEKVENENNNNLSGSVTVFQIPDDKRN